MNQEKTKLSSTFTKEQKIRKTVANILKRAQLCIEAKGGHFELKM